MELLTRLKQQLQGLEERSLIRRRRTVDTPCAPRLTVDGRAMLAFCSNDYLGLASHPRIVAALQEGATLYGAGSGASHLISGHSRAHALLEERLAAFVGANLEQARALYFCTGYMANLAVLTALAAGDAETEIFSEALNHASLIDGTRLARVKTRVYPHADLDALAALLGRERAEPQWLQPATDAALPAMQTLAVLPADLLRSRPDIQSAEAAVEQAAAEVGVSHAALYPRLTLTGSLLYAYNLTRNHRTTSDSIPMVGPQIDIPLFDWGRRRAVADGKELALQASIKAYRQTVLNGIAEAETALAAVAAQQQRQQQLQSEKQIHAGREKAQAVRQQLGLSSELAGIDSARASLQNQSELATARAAEALAYVALYKAVGAAPVDAALVTRTTEAQP